MEDFIETTIRAIVFGFFIAIGIFSVLLILGKI